MTEPRPVNIPAPLAERIEAAAVSQGTPFETAVGTLLEVGLGQPGRPGRSGLGHTPGGGGLMVGPTKQNTKRKDQPQAAPLPIPTTVPDALRDRTWGLAEEWLAAGWPWMAALLKGAVALSKAER